MGKIFSKNAALTVNQPLRAHYTAGRGWETTQGWVGKRTSLTAMLQTLENSGYTDLDYEEKPNNMAVLTARMAAYNFSDPTLPANTNTYEIVWELFGNNTVESLNNSPNARGMETAWPGITKAIEAAVDAYKQEVQSSSTWTGTTAQVSQKIVDAWTKYHGKFGGLSQTLFELKARGIDTFQFTAWSLRKSVIISSATSALAAAIYNGICLNTDRYFTKGQLISSESGTMTAAFASILAGTGYYIKHSPHILTSSTGRVTATVEYLYTESLNTFAYSAAT